MLDNLGSKVSLIGENFTDSLDNDLWDPFLIYYLKSLIYDALTKLNCIIILSGLINSDPQKWTIFARVWCIFVLFIFVVVIAITCRGPTSHAADRRESRRL